ncbi:ATP-binding cassette domain-containing protein [Streptomyces phaeochromogenes]
MTPSSSGSSSVNTPQQVGLRVDAHFEDIAHASWWRMAARLPRTLAAATRIGWAADRSAMLWLAGCRLAVVASSAVALAALPAALAQLFQSGQVAERVAAAAPALLAEADPHTVWSKVGLVPQDYTRWPMDLRANIHLGQPRSESDALLLDAARAAGAESVVAHVPQGLDPLVAGSHWGGTDLSGGQRQRIAVARAFYRDAAMLMLDGNPPPRWTHGSSTW